jgi:hypothetical protein
MNPVIAEDMAGNKPRHVVIDSSLALHESVRLHSLHELIVIIPMRALSPCGNSCQADTYRVPVGLYDSR